MAAEGAMLYFLCITLVKVSNLYSYSLEAFTSFFEKTFETAEEGDTIAERVKNLSKTLRLQIYTWIQRGLFVRHKILFLLQIVLRLMQKAMLAETYSQSKVDYLMFGPARTEASPCDWLPDTYWGSVVALMEISDFSALGDAISKEATVRFKEWFNEIDPEMRRVPGDYKHIEGKFEKLMVLRAMRPDRLTTAIPNWINGILP